MSANLPRRVALAAGGTGGHMFPAQALARELLARGSGVALITDQRGGGFGPDLPQGRDPFHQRRRAWPVKSCSTSSPASCALGWARCRPGEF